MDAPDTDSSDVGSSDVPDAERDAAPESDTRGDSVDQRADGEVLCPLFVPRDASVTDAPAGPTCAPSPLDIWTEQNIVLPSPHFGNSNLLTFNIFSLAPDNAWLASEKGMLHWDGISWSDGFVNPDDTFPSSAVQGFNEVWAAGPLDLWAGSAQGIRHWDGNALSAPLMTGFFTNLRGTASDDVWAIVDGKLLGHWDGSSWTLAKPYPTGTHSIATVWPAARNDVWAIATAPEGQLFHWDGQAWNAVPACLPPTLSYRQTSMWGSAPDDIWLSAPHATLHYDGKAWTQTERRFGGGQIWGNCASDVWMNDWDEGAVAHFDGVRWSHVQHLRGEQIHGSGPDDVWLNNPGSETLIFHRHLGTAAAACGNYRIDPGETCDPYWAGANGCSPTCQLQPGCGNGVIEANEECDPPEAHVCDRRCQLFPVCGNSLPDPGEQCDPPFMQFGSEPWCDSMCQIQR